MTEKEMLTKALDHISQIDSDVKAMKLKGTGDSEAIAGYKKSIDELSKHFDEKTGVTAQIAALQKNLDEVAVLAKQAKTIDYSNESDITKALKDQKTNLINLKNTGSGSVSMKLNLNEMIRKAVTVTEGSSLSGTGLNVIPPTRMAGVFADPLRPIHIRQYINSSNTNVDQIFYNKENTVTDGSAMTAEGSAATQSDFSIAATYVPVRKLNTYITMSKEMLDDADFVENYINTRLVGRLLNKEDQQLLYGTNVSPQADGLTTEARSVQLAPSRIGSSINYFDVLHGAVAQGRTTFYDPNLILVHPTDYNAMALSRDLYGRYQFGDAAILGMPLKANGAIIVQNTAVTQGYFLVGDMNMGATFFLRKDVEVTFANQHASQFTSGLVTAMIEERFALAIHNPGAFIYGNFINAMQSGS